MTNQLITLAAAEGALALIFHGHRLASITAAPYPWAEHYSGDRNRWQLLALYRSQDQQWVGHRLELADRPALTIASDYLLTPQPAELLAFFGLAPLAVELYRRAGLAELAARLRAA